MDFWTIILDLTRRKLFTPPLVAVAAAAAAIVYLLTPVHYTSSVLMVLTTSATGASQDPSKPSGLTNPLLGFTDGLKTTSSILIQSMNTPEVYAELGAPKDGSTVLVVDDGRTDPALLDISGPYVYVSVDARSARTAADVVARAQARVRSDLDVRQQALGAPPSTYILVADVVPAATPERVVSGRVQGALLAFVLCLAGGFGVAYGVVRAQLIRRQSGPKKEPKRGLDETDDHGSLLRKVADLSREPEPELFRIVASDYGDKQAESDEPGKTQVFPVVSPDDFQVVVVMSETETDDAEQENEAGPSVRAVYNGVAPEEQRRA